MERGRGRIQISCAANVSLILLLAAGAANAAGGRKPAPFVLPGCSVMFEPGAPCWAEPAPGQKGCCMQGFACERDESSTSRRRCMQLPSARQSFTATAAQACSRRVAPDGDCGSAAGGDGGPDPGACCADGFSCQADRPATDAGAASNGTAAVAYTCKADSAFQPLAAVASSAAQLPPSVPALPSGACSCRVNSSGKPVRRDCPSPWDHPAGATRARPALTVDAAGALTVAATGAPAALRGVNWFGWEVNDRNPGGLKAFCDDNAKSCPPGGEIPPHDYPSAAVGAAGQNAMQIYYWGKRRLTNDFATVAWRMRLLGFNAVRLPFSFAALAQELADDPPVTACVNELDEWIAASKTFDPQLLAAGAAPQLPAAYAYSGMRHPPDAPGQPAACAGPWTAPFLPSYDGPRAGLGSELRLTICNWYLPSGAGVLGLHRFLWQVQYLVSQGFYVILDFHPTSDATDPNAADPNAADPALLAANWGALWGALVQLPSYKASMKGRVIADLINEASKYGCQWDVTCHGCAAGSELVARASDAIRDAEPDALISVNGMGQDGAGGGCGPGAYRGMNWGDGFITNKKTVTKLGLSDPSFLFRYSLADGSARQQLLAPHPYPSSITGWASAYDSKSAARKRWDLSWGKKARGKDRLSDGKTKVPRAAVLLGEFGVLDTGNNTEVNGDTTAWSAADGQWLSTLSKYTRSTLGARASWLVWAWNANSGDTRGIVGPQTTWREVQWTKVRALVRSWGLRPWFCAALPAGDAAAYGCGAGGAPVY
ncbi:glycoside hydrolase [Raphidocelis subcapitata]|uniref:Glycoside hydrolase n=1 Tax=Raphidocelis subcapitata TaxID=307507 RepID=A0A2V0P882_9CHLO|nr:glycoside hydrolase [Raphidocelis subcapitata]|eukprot:GBF93295.1 glycoside hydrolase [Raphidocelis subcapitata]